jgi:hypothetical protein
MGAAAKPVHILHKHGGIGVLLLVYGEMGLAFFLLVVFYKGCIDVRAD